MAPSAVQSTVEGSKDNEDRGKECVKAEKKRKLKMGSGDRNVLSGTPVPDAAQPVGVAGLVEHALNTDEESKHRKSFLQYFSSFCLTVEANSV